MNYKDYNDNQLLFLVNEENEDANNIMYTKYKPLIVSKARKMYQGVNSGIEINDLIQEGMLGLNQAIINFDPEKDVTFYTFAKTCIERKMISLLIANKRLKHKFLNESISFDLSISDDESTSLKDLIGTSDNNPELLLINNEQKEELILNIKKVLTPLEEEVFLLKINNFDYNEIASMLSIQSKSVDNALQRIKSKIRKILEER